MFRVVVCILLQLMCAGALWAQTNSHVTIHADPRLNVLVNKSKKTEHSATRHKSTIAHAIGTSSSAQPEAQATPSSGTTTLSYYREPKRGKYKGKGFKVQIYSGNNKEKAIQIMSDFLRRYPRGQCYLSFLMPDYRVRVGNYRYREDAAGMYREMNGIYELCMIVPDNVEIK